MTNIHSQIAHSQQSLYFMALGILLCTCATVQAQVKREEPAPVNLSAPQSGIHDTITDGLPKSDMDQDPVRSPDPEPEAGQTTGTPANRPDIEHSPSGNGIYSMQADVDEVLLNCSVTDKRGKVVIDLERSEFRIWEDGVPQTIKSFLHQDRPISLGILIDNSGSMREKRTAVNAGVLTLIKASNKLDTTFIVNFTEHAYLDQTLLAGDEVINEDLTPREVKGATALYDAVAASADELTQHAQYPRQILLVITDGDDNASRLSLEEAVSRVQQLGGPVVYTIGILSGVDHAEAQRVRRMLERLSLETGGYAYFPESLDEVNSVATAVAHDIRNQYTLGYRPTKPANQDGYRTVHIEASGSEHGKLNVRTRKGYYSARQVSQLLHR